MTYVLDFTCFYCGRQGAAELEDGVERLDSLLCDVCIRDRKRRAKEALSKMVEEKPIVLKALYKPIGY